MQYLTKTPLITLTLAAGLATASIAHAGPVNDNFEELDNNPIAEFRGNGDNSSWSFGTGKDTQTTGSFDESGYNWQPGAIVNWRFQVTGNTSTLVVGDFSTDYTGLTPDQLNASTLAIHAKDNVAFSYDFTGLGSGELLGTTVPEERFEFDWDYLTLDGGLDGVFASGTISFLDEEIKSQSGTGVTFKVGNIADVPEPGTMALLGLGLLGLGAARRHKA